MNRAPYSCAANAPCNGIFPLHQRVQKNFQITKIFCIFSIAPLLNRCQSFLVIAFLDILFYNSKLWVTVQVGLRIYCADRNKM